MNFACTGCGLCCKNVKGILDEAKGYQGNDPILKEASSFPYKADENGACEMLGEDGKCSVYDNRPLICDVEALHEKYYTKEMSQKEWFLQNAQLCNQMMKEAKMKGKLVNETQYL